MENLFAVMTERQITTSFNSYLPLTCLRNLRYAAVTLLLVIGVGNVWGTDEVYKTARFGSSYNSKSVGSYTDSWTATNSGFTVALTNFNNNNNGWAFVKCGRKDNASVATIITNAAIDKAITKVEITIDAVTSSKVNSIKLYTSTNNSTWTEVGSFTVETGNQSVTLSSPTANLYYKVEFDCASGSSNGLVTISKVNYYVVSKTLSSISIRTQPTKRKYLVGETFSKTGAVVQATYSDASTANVTATWTPTGALTAGTDKTVTASYTEGGVTKTATTTIDVYSVTVQVKDVDGNTLSGAGAPTASATGASITASASGNNYVFKRWVAVTAAGTSFANASSRTTTLSGTPTGAVTIIAEYYKPITITWNANGSAYTPGTPGTTQVGYGTLMSALTLPSPAPSPASFCGNKFMGWTTKANVSQNDDTGLNLFTSVAGNSTAITEDLDFYAVFADYAE